LSLPPKAPRALRTRPHPEPLGAPAGSEERLGAWIMANGRDSGGNRTADPIGVPGRSGGGVLVYGKRAAAPPRAAPRLACAGAVIFVAAA
jgi:hypothetical protein